MVRHWLSEHQAVRDNQHEFQLEPDEDIFNNVPVGYSGMSPSGKALGSGSSIRGFESLHPSQMIRIEPRKTVVADSPKLPPLLPTQKHYAEADAGN